MHSWQGERDPSVSVWSGQGPRLSPLSPPSEFSLPFLPCPPLFLTLPSSLLVTFWHVHLSVCLVRPDTGPSQVSPNANIQAHGDGNSGDRKREKESKRRLPRTAETHAFRNVETYILEKPKHKNADIFIQSAFASFRSSQPSSHAHKHHQSTL